MADENRRKAVFLVGPWLVGSFLDIFLQGILIHQFTSYWIHYRDDRLAMKLAVIGLMILTILKSVQVFALSWIQNILHLQDLEGAIALSSAPWLMNGNSMMVATIDLYVQAYFCYRLCVISRSKWVVVPIVTLCLFAWATMIIATYCISAFGGANPNVGRWFAVHLATVFGADVIMSMTTAFFLMKSRKKVHNHYAGILNALLRLTFQTAAPAALCATLNLIFSQAFSSNDNIISTAFNQALPKLYAVSMMWTLNARREIRVSARATDPPSSDRIPGWASSRLQQSRDDDCGMQILTSETVDVSVTTHQQHVYSSHHDTEEMKVFSAQ